MTKTRKLELRIEQLERQNQELQESRLHRENGYIKRENAGLCGQIEELNRKLAQREREYLTCLFGHKEEIKRLSRLLQKQGRIVTVKIASLPEWAL